MGKRRSCGSFKRILPSKLISLFIERRGKYKNDVLSFLFHIGGLESISFQSNPHKKRLDFALFDAKSVFLIREGEKIVKTGRKTKVPTIITAARING